MTPTPLAPGAPTSGGVLLAVAEPSMSVAIPPLTEEVNHG